MEQFGKSAAPNLAWSHYNRSSLHWSVSDAILCLIFALHCVIDPFWLILVAVLSACFGAHMGMLAIDFGAIHRGQCLQFRRDSLQQMLANAARFIAVNAYNLGAIRRGQCEQFWRDSLQWNSAESLQRMFTISAWFIAVNACIFGVIYCSECVQLWSDSLQRMPTISAWFIVANVCILEWFMAVNAYNFRQDALQRMITISCTLAAAAATAAAADVL